MQMKVTKSSSSTFGWRSSFKEEKGGTLRGWRAGDSINSPRSSDRSRVTLSLAGDQRETGDRRATRAPPLVAQKRAARAVWIFPLLSSLLTTALARRQRLPAHHTMNPRRFLTWGVRSRCVTSMTIFHGKLKNYWKFHLFVSDLYVLVLKPFISSR